MSAPEWLSYVGVVTGIAGAVMGYVSLRRGARLKALELRLELRKSEADTRLALENLPGLFEKAENSRLKVAAATGRYSSGATEQWRRDLEADRSVAKALQATLPPAPNDYTSLTHTELEAKLVELHSLRSKVMRLSEKYQAELAADDKEREHLRVRHQ
jgi:hypothetical protein